MHGLMMQRPLLISELLTYAAEVHGDVPVVSAKVEGGLDRSNYRKAAERAGRLAQGLMRLGTRQGDRVATLAWNGFRHFELYHAISGIGAVCHTINPRLSTEQMRYIVEHAGDRLLFLDLTFVPLVEALRDTLPADLRLVVMTDRAHMPDTPLDVLCYEDLLENTEAGFAWPELDEDTAAALCYTSGTTGRPKGALFSHRSTVIHAFTQVVSIPPAFQPGRAVLPVVPLFHANGWGLPYSGPLTGTALVFPGPRLDGASLFDLMDGEEVYSAWGVPTVWLGLLAEIEKRGRLPKGFGHVVIGGSAAPRSMIEAFEAAGVDVCHAWGMTEMSPLGTHSTLPAQSGDMDTAGRIDRKATQGRRAFGVELKIVDDARRRLPHDGKAAGELFVRGHGVISGYFENPEATAAAMDDEGWFGTGDIARIDAEGFLSLADRAKDLIKSGGEWISSIDLENAFMAHPDVANCAVIAVPHPKWDERPLLVVEPGARRPDPSELMAMLEGRFARWQWPDGVEFVDTLPLTATGKVSKLALRERFADYRLPEAGV